MSFTIKQKVYFFVAFSLISILFMGYSSISLLKEEMYEDRKTQLKVQIETVEGILEFYQLKIAKNELTEGRGTISVLFSFTRDAIQW